MNDMQPIQHVHGRRPSFLSILAVATFVGVIALALATMAGLFAGGNPQILATFRTSDLLVDNTATVNGDTQLADVRIGSASSPHILTINGITTGRSTIGGLRDYEFDPNGLSFVDSVVGPVCTHGSGTDETMAIGWTPNCAIGLRAQLDIRTDNVSGTVANKDSAALYVEKSDTVNTGSAARSSYGIYVINSDNRGSGGGSGALTSYAAFIDNPCNAQTCYGAWVDRGDVYINTGNFTVHTGSASLQATTTTTMHASGQIRGDTTAVITGNIEDTTGNINTDIGNIMSGNDFEWTGTNAFLFTAAAVTGSGAQDVNIDAAGTGIIRLNANFVGTNAGTGGMILYAGSNSNTVNWSSTGAGNEIVRGNSTIGGTLNNTGGFTEVGDLNLQTASGVIYMYANSGANETINLDTAGTASLDINSNAGGITNSGTGGVRIFAGANSSTVTTTLKGSNGHHMTGGTAIGSIAGCGTGTPACVANSPCTDTSARIATGGTNTGCVVNLVSTYTKIPTCICQDETNSAHLTSCTPAAASITFVLVANSNDVISYICMGPVGGT